MKKLLAVLTFGFCSLTVQGQSNLEPAINAPSFWGRPIPPEAEHKPLVCGKYQHVYHTDSYTGTGPCSNDNCLSIAISHPEVNECHDDMHEITERDWHALMQRIDKLESQAKK